MNFLPNLVPHVPFYIIQTGGAGDGRSVRVSGMDITSKISYYGWTNEALSGHVSKLRETTYIYQNNQAKGQT